MNEIVERMQVTVAALEAAAVRWQEREATLHAGAEELVGRLVATAEEQRESELWTRLQAAEAKLAEAEGKLADLAASATGGRKTAAAGMVSTLAKQGISANALEGLESGRMEGSALDTALASLSIEQRFAVKAEMLRNGLLG